MNGETRPRVTPSQIIWIAACVVLLTSLFLIGAWLFKPAGDGEPGGKAGSGEVTEQEVNTPGFTPEGQAPGARALPPPPQEAPPVNAAIPTPASLAPRYPSQPTPPPARTPEKPAFSAVVEVPAGGPKPAETSAPAKVNKPDVEPRGPVTPKGAWFLQVAAVSDREKAAQLQKLLREKGFPSAPLVHEGGLYKVRIPCRDEGDSRATKKKLDAATIKGTEGAFVVKPEK